MSHFWPLLTQPFFFEASWRFLIPQYYNYNKIKLFSLYNCDHNEPNQPNDNTNHMTCRLFVILFIFQFNNILYTYRNENWLNILWYRSLPPSSFQSAQLLSGSFQSSAPTVPAPFPPAEPFATVEPFASAPPPNYPTRPYAAAPAPVASSYQVDPYSQYQSNPYPSAETYGAPEAAPFGFGYDVYQGWGPWKKSLFKNYLFLSYFHCCQDAVIFSWNHFYSSL